MSDPMTSDAPADAPARVGEKAERLYPQLEPWSLEPYYCRHVSAMTAEKLHGKSDIAVQLAWRDKRIDELTAERDRLAAKFSAAVELLQRWNEMPIGPPSGYVDEPPAEEEARFALMRQQNQVERETEALLADPDCTRAATELRELREKAHLADMLTRKNDRQVELIESHRAAYEDLKDRLAAVERERDRLGNLVNYIAHFAVKDERTAHELAKMATDILSVNDRLTTETT